MAWFTAEEESEFERVVEESYNESYKCPFCPNKDGCGYFSCPNQIAMGEEVCWESPFESLDGLDNVDLSKLSGEDVPPGFIIREGEELHSLIGLVGDGLPFVSVLNREEGGRCASCITYVFVHPERRRLIAPVLNRLAEFARFVQSIQDGSGDHVNRILEADPEDLEWMVLVFRKSNLIFGENLLVDIVENGTADKLKQMLSIWPFEQWENDLDLALNAAIQEEDEEMVLVLILAGAQIDSQDYSGETALMEAARSGQTDIVRLLVNAGAATHLKDRHGRTAADHAQASGHTTILVMLESNAKQT